eukprot:TRINITY_DN5316_c0_g1_i1.p1 TRINITY_DN5316_c0_g1~~TRINITY_DN5316_c0_g1_i1.p1  ORF type:complete len:431 (-),score=41.87 TRINITY_DN5316_c0_g1_i1:95-1387(-)
MVIASNLAKAVVKCMRGYPTCPKVQRHGVNAIAELVMHVSKAEALKVAGATERVVTAMVILRSDRQVWLTGLRAIRELARAPCWHRHLCCGGAVEVIVEALRSFPGETEVLHEGMIALSAVLDHARDSHAGRQVLTAGGAVFVVRALTCCADNKRVQKYAVCAMQHLVCEEDHTALCAAGACEALVTAISTPPVDVVDACVQASCLNVIESMASNATTALVLASKGACEAVMASAEYACDWVSLEVDAWLALHMLCSCAENVVRLGACGACQALVTALNRHASNICAVQACVSAAVRLAQHDGNAVKLVAAGCCEALVAAMDAHCGSADIDDYKLSIIQQEALAALAALASTTSCAARFGISGCVAVRTAIQHFPHDEILQRRAVEAAVRLAQHEPNRRWLCINAGPYTAAIEAAYTETQSAPPTTTSES